VSDSVGQVNGLRALALTKLPLFRQTYANQFRRLTPGGLAVLISTIFGFLLLIFSIYRLDIVPNRLLNGITQLFSFLTLMLPPLPQSGAQALGIVKALGQTLAIAFLGTIGAAIIALPLAFLAAHNTTLHGILRFLSRRGLDAIRGIDALIWALIWVSVVGLGPFAGVLAILTSDIGTFGKLFSEAIEAADLKQQEGIIASGGSEAERVRFGILPQVLPVLAGQLLYIFESNVRSSSIIGIVGAGGIGLHLAEMIRTLEWGSVAFIVLLTLVVVGLIDGLSAKIRGMIAGQQRT
jgi:phosphonate transport system permease protein